MGIIINFPRQESAGYRNLKMLFEVVGSVESCNFYLESAEQLFENGDITENELLTLRRIGRQKRIRLANPPQKRQRAYYGKHYFLDTPLHLKGRGITLVKSYAADELTQSGKYKAGWSEYRVTKKAFEKLKEQYAISFKRYLD